MREEMNKNKVECLRLEGLIETHTKTEKDCRAERKKMETTSDTLRKSVSGSDAKLKELDQKIQKLEDTQKQGTHEDEMKELSDLIVQCDREIASLEFEEKRLHQERERAEKEDSKLEEVKLLRKRLVRVVFERAGREYHFHLSLTPIVSLAHGISLECTLEYYEKLTSRFALEHRYSVSRRRET